MIRFLGLPLLFAAVLTGFVSPVAAQTLDWDAAKTWVFAVGLLEWEQGDTWSPFPAAQVDRRDQQLVDYFRKAGVPEAQVVFLKDSQGTKQRIQQSFQKLLEQTGPDDLLVFYFAGHGSRDSKTGEISFVHYDAKSGDAVHWPVRGICDTIESGFHGKRVVLLADCCHSGALCEQARKRQSSKLQWAAVTSSSSQNGSTGNWTFTDSLLAGLRGEPQVDANRDAVVDFAELGRYCELEMAFIEDQRALFAAHRSFQTKGKLAPVAGQVAPNVGDRIEVEYEGKWYRAKTLEADGDQRKVRYANYDESWDEWVGPARMRAFKPVNYPAGAKVDVKWGSDQKWYPATVVKAWQGLHHIHYDGYGPEFDEWASPNSIRRR